MLKKQSRMIVVLIILILVVGAVSSMASANGPATPEEIEASIVDGLAWLAGRMI